MSGQALARAAQQLRLDGFEGDRAGDPAGARAHPPRHLCSACRQRQARFRYRGVVKADRAHTLCFQCYRAELNRLRARRTLAVPPVTERILPMPECRRLLDLRRRRAQIAARHATVDAR